MIKWQLNGTDRKVLQRPGPGRVGSDCQVLTGLKWSDISERCLFQLCWRHSRESTHSDSKNHDRMMGSFFWSSRLCWLRWHWKPCRGTGCILCFLRRHWARSSSKGESSGRLGSFWVQERSSSALLLITNQVGASSPFAGCYDNNRSGIQDTWNMEGVWVKKKFIRVTRRQRNIFDENIKSENMHCLQPRSSSCIQIPVL